MFTQKDIGLNSISGVLTSGKDRAALKGMDSLPLVPHTLLRKVKPQEFDSYLKSLADVIDKYSYNSHMGIQVATEGTPILGGSTDTNTQAEATLSVLILNAKVSVTNTTTNTKSKQQYKVEKKLHNRMFSGNAPNIDTVPAIFFDQSFNLCNPRTFEAVCAASTSTTNADSTADSTLLQEKLGHYLDTVEIHLIREISRRSASFFAALANLQSLLHQTQDCVQKINQNRRLLSHLSSTTALDALQIVKLKRRRGNLVSSYGSVKLVHEITQTLGDFVGSLDLIAETSLLLRGSPSHYLPPQIALTPSATQTHHTSIIPRSLDLRGVKSLTNLAGRMSDMVRVIGGMMETEFVNVIIGDLDETVASLPNVNDIRRNGVPLPLGTTPAATWVRNILDGNFSLMEMGAGAGAASPELLQMGQFGEKLAGRLHPLVLGLLRMDRLGSALALFKDTIVQRIKYYSKKDYPNNITTALDESVQNSPVAPSTPSLTKKQDQHSTLAKYLRAMQFEAFSDLLLTIYSTLLYTLQHISITHAVISKIVAEAQGSGVVIGAEDVKGPATAAPDNLRPLSGKFDDDDDLGSIDLLCTSFASPKSADTVPAPVITSTLATSQADDLCTPTTSSSFTEMLTESADILYSSTDLIHMRCSKLVGVRSEQNAQLNPGQFYPLFGATLEFVYAGEALNGRICFGLKSTMLSQAKAFLNFFHEEKSKQIALLIENEQWAQAEVPIDFQNIIHLILSGAADGSTSATSSTAPPLSLYQQGSEDIGGSETDLSSSAPVSASDVSTATNTTATASSKFLIVCDQKFYAVGALLLFLKMLTDYMRCIDHIPGLTNDVLNRILEVLKLFNSRVCQVILGAGAMRSAGLKNITARHIALASQSLGVITLIIPHLKATISGKLPVKQQVLLTDFDRLLRDYREHQSELYFKLVSIMQERLSVHCKSLMGINWDSPDQKDFSVEDGASLYMSMLVKETCTLFRVLFKYLNLEALKKIMVEVFRVYALKLEEDLRKLELFSSAGKNRLLIDVQFYIEKLGSLDSIDGPGNHLEVVVNSIKIRDRRTVMATAASASGNIRSSASLDFGSSGSLSSDAKTSTNAASLSSTNTRKYSMFTNFRNSGRNNPDEK